MSSMGFVYAGKMSSATSSGVALILFAECLRDRIILSVVGLNKDSECFLT